MRTLDDLAAKRIVQLKEEFKSTRQDLKDLTGSQLSYLDKCHILKDYAEGDKKFIIYDPFQRLTYEMAKSNLSMIYPKFEHASTFGLVKVIYNPNKLDKIFVDKNAPLASYFNRYSPPEHLLDYKHVPPIRDVPEPFLDLVNHLTMGNSEATEYILNWFAYSFSFNSVRPFLCLFGDEGTGKGSLAFVAQLIHGDNNFVKVRDSVLKKDFNSSLAYRTFIFIDELKLTSEEHLNRLKNQTNKTIEVEFKGKDTVYIDNYSCTMIASNNLAALPLSERQRRFSVINLTEQKLLDSTEVIKKYGNLDEFFNALECCTYDLGLHLLYRLDELRASKVNMETPYKPENYEDLKMLSAKHWEEHLLNNYIPEAKNHYINHPDYSLTTKSIIPDFINIPLSEVQSDLSKTLRITIGAAKIKDTGKNYPKVFQLIEVKKPNRGYVMRVFLSEEEKNELMRKIYLRDKANFDLISILEKDPDEKQQ